MRQLGKIGDEIILTDDGSPAAAGLWRGNSVRLDDGRFVSVWVETLPGTASPARTALRAQVFDAEGAAIGDPFPLSQPTSASQRSPRIAALDDGLFAVAWENVLVSGGDLPFQDYPPQVSVSINSRLQVFDTDGNTASPIISPGGNSPDLARFGDNRIVVTWEDWSHVGDDKSDNAVRAQVYDATLRPVDPSFQVNVFTEFGQWRQDVAGLGNGGFVVSWSDHDFFKDGSAPNIRARLYDAGGQPLGLDFRVNTTVVGWQYWSKIEALDEDRFVIVWQQHFFADPFNRDLRSFIRGQVFLNDGTPVGQEFKVNESEGRANGQRILVLEDGRFIVSWTDHSREGEDKSGTAVRAQLFDAEGRRIGAEIQINTSTEGNQSAARLIVLDGGRIVAGWHDASDNSWRQQVLGFNAPATGRVEIEGSAAMGQTLQARALDLDDPDGLGPLVWQWLADGVPIAGATGDSFVPGRDEAGKRIAVRLGWTDGAGFAETLLSPETEPVALRPVLGTWGPDLLIGTDMNDTISGEGGDDTIHGGAGDDLLDGGPGDDLIYGESGNNTLSGGTGSDTIHGGSGDDVIHGGGNGANQLFGHDGNDLIHGGNGGDLIGGGAGNDTIRGGAGHDTIYGWFGDDDIGGGPGNDLIFGSYGRNIIWGGLGDDTVHGGEGSDTIHGGGDGTNHLFGHDGDDLIFAGAGGDLIGGGAGNDTIRGGAGNDTIWGWLGDDDIGGGPGHDVIHASFGNNMIWGGEGNDTIHAGTGHDVMSGGPGADRFVFASAAHIGIGASRDRITDFTRGADRIDLSALLTRFNGEAGPLGGGQASFYHWAPGGLLIGDQTGNGLPDWVIELPGVASLAWTDFIL